MINFKKFFAIALSGAACFTAAFGLSACGDNGGASNGILKSIEDNISDSALESIKNSTSDTADLIVWSKAMASEDIYNSTAVCITSNTSTKVSGTTTTSETYSSREIACIDITNTNGKLTGNTYNYAEITETAEDGAELSHSYIQAENYQIISDSQLISYMCSGSDCYVINSETSDDGFTVEDTYIEDIYVHYSYSDGYFSGVSYSVFTYDDSLGSYVYEYTVGSTIYDLELKFSNENLTYCKISSYYFYSGSYSKETVNSAEYYYIYDAVTVAIPDEVQSKIDSVINK